MSRKGKPIVVADRGLNKQKDKSLQLIKNDCAFIVAHKSFSGFSSKDWETCLERRAGK
ncbi:hypothetical protein [Turicimonas muris]|uniref:hypothetical protein n=1 Tax=Turicimonas muris TaxID=1796652 RepID=UPI003F665953